MILLPLTLAAVTAGCSTFSDSDVVARVNDVELTNDEFDARLTELGVHPMTAPGLVPGLLGLVTALLGGILTARSVRTGNDSVADVVGGDSRGVNYSAYSCTLVSIKCRFIDDCFWVGANQTGFSSVPLITDDNFL